MARRLRLLLLALAGLIIAAKVVAWFVQPASFSPRILPNLYLVTLCLQLLRRSRSLEPTATVGVKRAVALALLGCITLAFLVATAWADWGLQNRKQANVYENPHKIWAARGLVLNDRRITRHGTQNSIESIERAFQHGAQGVEVDAYFDPPLGRYVVSHDRPYNLKNGELLTLGPLLDAVGTQGEFWLDLKKLRHLAHGELNSAIAELARLTSTHGLKGRFYVEGEDPVNLSAYRRAGFLTVYDTHPLTDANPLTPLVVDLYKLIYYFGDHSVMGMNSGEGAELIYGPVTRRALLNVPMFIYHAPDEHQRINVLLSNPDVRVILIGDQTFARFDLSAPNVQ